MLVFLWALQLEPELAGMPSETWRMELRRHLTGSALRFWFHLWNAGVDMKDCDAIKHLMTTRYCEVTEELLKLRLLNARWEESAVDYPARFAEVVGEGLPLPSDEVVSLSLAKLPDDVLMEVTTSGYRTFATCDEAAAELRMVEGTADRLRRQVALTRLWRQEERA
ncbi:hypothetical protein EPH_0006130 [Eimeria praecox]|uniref:Uncharacterized protein n=1 Tax=Eimeria praecox TaxID=51316 RepID=U6H680_9EIME|nr:hypothetical protein EPH_0006130 [Eimeria praecox]